MLNRRRSWIGLCLMATLGVTTSTAWGQNQDARSLWVDFNHYVRIARPDLAKAAGEKLLSTVNDAQLLDIVEGTREYQDYDRTLVRASKVDELKQASDELGRRIQQARIARSRESSRITSDIQALGQGARASRNATERLRAAGPYAAPALLNALLEEKNRNLHPYILEAMVSIGRPLVAPLTAALDKLEPVQQAQVAQVLAEIGYPRALPVLKLVIENPRTDAAARATATTAYNQLARSVNVNSDLSAAELYLQLADNLFNAGSGDTSQLVGIDSATRQGLIWSYSPSQGLTYVAVPAEIFADVQAMEAAQTALTLNPGMDYALSAWLMSNLRRENRLGEGKTDPSYPAEMLPPQFYLEMAGPLRQHDVLARALAINDADLALDAIRALSATAGTDALVRRSGGAQPLLAALSSPDRRVRYEAAFALTNARPSSTFAGADRVVPVLAQAVRQSDTKYAAVIGSDTASANRIKDALARAGYQAFGDTTLRDVQQFIANEPGIDLLVTNIPSDQLDGLMRQTDSDYKLSAIPVVILTTPGQQNAINARYGTQSRVKPVLWSDDVARLQGAIEQIVGESSGKPMEAEEALEYATRALSLLNEVALGASNVFDVLDAQAALIQALNDQRSTIVTQASQVLARINTVEAQQAIADAALDIARPTEARVDLLNSLAASATAHGSKLNASQLDAVLELVKTSRGELAISAARAHGALTLPTSNLVQLLTQKK